MSDTPRTDFFLRCKSANSQDMMSVCDFARTLEREIAALKKNWEASDRKLDAEIAALKEANHTLERSWLNACDEAAALKAERDEQKRTAEANAAVAMADRESRADARAENERLRSERNAWFELHQKTAAENERLRAERDEQARGNTIFQHEAMERRAEVERLRKLLGEVAACCKCQHCSGKIYKALERKP